MENIDWAAMGVVKGDHHGRGILAQLRKVEVHGFVSTIALVNSLVIIRVNG